MSPEPLITAIPKTQTSVAIGDATAAAIGCSDSDGSESSGDGGTGANEEEGRGVGTGTSVSGEEGAAVGRLVAGKMTSTGALLIEMALGAAAVVGEVGGTDGVSGAVGVGVG